MIPSVYHTRKLASTSELATTVATSISSSTFLSIVVHAWIQRLLSCPAVFLVWFIFFCRPHLPVSSCIIPSWYHQWVLPWKWMVNWGIFSSPRGLDPGNQIREPAPFSFMQKSFLCCRWLPSSCVWQGGSLLFLFFIPPQVSESKLVVRAWLSEQGGGGGWAGGTYQGGCNMFVSFMW